MSSSSTPKYDVFLSSAEDTRKGLVSHLNRSLTQRGITTFFSDDKLEKRASSSPVSEFYDPWIYTMESKVAVVVVSQSYLVSALCLDELQTILLKQGRLFVLPIYYGVDPFDETHYFGPIYAAGELAEPFKKLREAYPMKFHEWQRALIELSERSPYGLLDSYNLSGDAELVEEITRKVEALLSHFDKSINQKGTYPITDSVSELVGLDRQMQALNLLLDSKCNEEVGLIGIWGPGGIGKTTLARFAYGNLSNNFHAHVFVDNAKNIFQNDPDKSRSLEAFTSGSQEGARKKTREPNLSTGVIKSMVRHRKTLIVLDCVDNIKQLKDIAEIICWCGSGSRVILITQNKKLLDEFGVDHVYEVESLRYDEALQLFSQSAFIEQNPPTSFESLSLRAVEIANFLPLTLKILGSSLQGKDEEEWEKKLQKLEGDQEKAIMEIMKKNYIRENEEDQIPSFILPQ